MKRCNGVHHILLGCRNRLAPNSPSAGPLRRWQSFRATGTTSVAARQASAEQIRQPHGGYADVERWIFVPCGTGARIISDA